MKTTLVALFFFTIQMALSQISDTKNINLDHIFVVADLNSNTIEKIEKSGLVIAKNWRTPHTGQGTTGDFIFFMNFYFEILQIADPTTATKNISEMGTDLNERLFSTNNTNSPYGIGLVQKVENLKLLPFVTKKYHQVWMGEGNNLEMAIHDNKLPIIFVEPKSFENIVYENKVQLEADAKYNPDAKKYREHKNNIKNLTAVEIIKTDNKKDTDAVKSLKNFQNVKITNGKKPLLILTFDQNIQKKQIDLSQELGVIMKY